MPMFDFEKDPLQDLLIPQLANSGLDSSLQIPKQNIAVPMEGLPQTDVSSLVKNAISQKLDPNAGLTDPETLRNAQQQSAQGKLYAGVAQAGDTIANAIAGSNRPTNNQYYEDLKTQANQPVQDIITARKTALENQNLQKQTQLNEKQLKAYDPNSVSSGVARNLAKQRLLSAGMKQADIDKIITPEMSAGEVKDALEHGISGIETSSTKKELGKYLQAARTKGLEIKEKGLDLRTGAQAAQVAKAFNSDKLIQTTTQQQGQIDKALGRLADIESGKLPFSQNIKADIEKDVANIISGGTSSSLGQLDRIEFQPLSAKYNNFLSKIKGVPLDIRAPEYAAQLKTLLQGLQTDINGIQSKRAQFLRDSLSPAYANNPLAMQTINKNVDIRNPQKAQMSAEDKEAVEWAQAHPSDKRAQQILQLHGM